MATARGPTTIRSGASAAIASKSGSKKDPTVGTSDSASGR
jgi:hypothetical protein